MSPRRSKNKDASASAPRAEASAPAPDKGGRPTKYRAEFASQATKLCALGAIDADLADFFGVNTSTIWRWAGTHAGFCKALKAGKSLADDRVERALYQRAVGFEHDAVKIMQYEGSPVIVDYREKVAPDTTACIFWMKNRRPKEWRDTQDHNINPSDDFRRLWAAIPSLPKEVAA